MFRILRTTALPKVLRTSFTSYERARQAIRKWLRASKNLHGNAAISTFGFSIQRVV